MTWNKGGDHGPWGPAPGSQPPQKPERDFDDLLRKGRNTVKDILPGGDDGTRLFIILIVIGLALWLGTRFLYRVEPDEQGVVLRFGEFHRMSAPGLHLRWPSPVEEVLTPKVTRINKVEVGYRSGMSERGVEASGNMPRESLMLTGDENIINLSFEIQWRIKDSKQFLFNTREPEETVKNAGESAVREVVGRTPIATLLTEGRSKAESDARVLLQKILDNYGVGIEVVRLQMLEVAPPAEVLAAFRDVQNAKSDQDTARNEAEAYRNDIIPRARGQAEQMVQEAKAYKEEVVARAQGEAQRFKSVYDAYAQAPDVTRRRLYLETMEQVLSGTPKLIMDNKNGAVPYLPLNALTPKPAEPKEKAQ